MNIEFTIYMLMRILPYYAILWCCGFTILAAFSIYNERYSWLDFFVALLVGAILSPILIPLLIIAKLFLIKNRTRSRNSTFYGFEVHVSNITDFILTKAVELGKFAKLNFSKRGRAKKDMLRREKLWNDEFYCGE